MAAAAIAAFSVIYMVHVRPTKDKFTAIFDRLHEHDMTVATVPAMAEDIKDVKIDIHELTNRFSELAQGVARIEGKLGCEGDN